MKLTTAIIPAAGKGTRLMPLTSAIPKELLPVGIHPALDYSITELEASGISRIVMITHPQKASITDYMDTHQHHFQLAYTHQPAPLGLGHAVLQAQHLVSANPSFAVCLPDDIMIGTPPATRYLGEMAHRYHYDMALMVQLVPAAQTSSYGIIGINRQLAPGIFDIQTLVEKPLASQAPSRYAIVGRYVLTPDIFSYLQTRTHHAVPGQEIQLTDALQDMLQAGYRILGVAVPGIRYDIGTLPGWLHAHLAISTQEPLLRPIMQEYVDTHHPLSSAMLAKLPDIPTIS